VVQLVEIYIRCSELGNGAMEGLLVPRYAATAMGSSHPERALLG
jgi:hypothetical protein